MKGSLNNIKIPMDWTGDEANAVVAFLYKIADAIWDVHENRMRKAIQAEQDVIERPDGLIGDDFPF